MTVKVKVTARRKTVKLNWVAEKNLPQKIKEDKSASLRRNVKVYKDRLDDKKSWKPLRGTESRNFAIRPRYLINKRFPESGFNQLVLLKMFSAKTFLLLL